jgi:hypothetical protein
LVAVGAGRQLRGEDGSAATLKRNEIDEGYEEGDDVDEAIGGVMYGPHRPDHDVLPDYNQVAGNAFTIQSLNHASWQWQDNSVPTGGGLNVADDDVASDIAADGDDEDGGYEDQRLLQDFADEIGGPIHQNSPMIVPLGEDGEVLMDQDYTNPVFEEEVEDLPTVDVHVDENWDDTLGEEHVKTD